MDRVLLKFCQSLDFVLLLKNSSPCTTQKKKNSGQVRYVWKGQLDLKIMYKMF